MMEPVPPHEHDWRLQPGRPIAPNTPIMAWPMEVVVCALCGAVEWRISSYALAGTLPLVANWQKA